MVTAPQPKANILGLVTERRCRSQAGDVAVAFRIRYKDENPALDTWHTEKEMRTAKLDQYLTDWKNGIRPCESFDIESASDVNSYWRPIGQGLNGFFSVEEPNNNPLPVNKSWLICLNGGQYNPIPKPCGIIMIHRCANSKARQILCARFRYEGFPPKADCWVPLPDVGADRIMGPIWKEWRKGRRPMEGISMKEEALVPYKGERWIPKVFRGVVYTLFQNASASQSLADDKLEKNTNHSVIAPPECYLSRRSSSAADALRSSRDNIKLTPEDSWVVIADEPSERRTRFARTDTLDRLNELIDNAFGVADEHKCIMQKPVQGQNQVQVCCRVRVDADDPSKDHWVPNLYLKGRRILDEWRDVRSLEGIGSDTLTPGSNWRPILCLSDGTREWLLRNKEIKLLTRKQTLAPDDERKIITRREARKRAMLPAVDEKTPVMRVETQYTLRYSDEDSEYDDDN